MTTIAYRDGVLAADSQTTRGNLSVNGAIKLIKSDTILAGICGDAHDMGKFGKWLIAVSEKCDNVEDFHLHNSPLADDADTEALIADVHGNAWYMHASGSVFKYNEDHAASGSGEYFALGALHMGATAVEAVEAAVALDLYTGGEVTSIYF